MVDLRGRSFLKELDFSAQEWTHLLDVAGELKTAKQRRREQPQLAGRNIALIFEKTSTRTRCAFEVAIHDQGGHCTYLDPSGSQLGHKESIADTARVLGQMYDGIEYRGFGQDRLETLAAYAGVPVWNGLTDQWHPTQMLADQLTMREFSAKPLAKVSLAYLGDARNNVANSLLVAGALMGMDVRMVAPKPLQNDVSVVVSALELAAQTGARISVTDDLDAVAGADFLYTDVWVSMGEPKDVWAERLNLLRDYQINAALLARTANPGVRVLHCLPAYHDDQTQVGRQIAQASGLTDGIEITHEVFEAQAESIFQQAGNRMHAIKAVLVETLKD